MIAHLVVCLSTHAAAQEATTDVRLVIDISGSMKKNDPKNLRRPALEMLVKLLPAGSKAGIWTFGRYVNLLVPHARVDEPWRQQAIDAGGHIKSIAQFTNIGQALEKAAYDATSQQTNSGQTHVILLTDGMVDISRDQQVNQQERQRILATILPMYTQANITLHTIALSDNADKELLKQLALATDGKAAIAKTADELMHLFLQVFDQAVVQDEVPFDGQGFVIDSSIEEFTALIFRHPSGQVTQLVAPDGTRYTQDSHDPYLRWHHTDEYDLMTLSQPLEGQWQVIADVAPNSRVTVVSDLSLAVSAVPANITTGTVLPLSLALKEEGQTITRADFLQLLAVRAEVSKDGKVLASEDLSANAIPKDGVYSTRLALFDQAGEYRIELLVDGKTFTRQQSHHVTVRQPFRVDVREKDQLGTTAYIIDVSAALPQMQREQTQMTGTLHKPSNKQQLLPFVLGDDGVWHLEVVLEEPGQHQLLIHVQTINNQQQAQFALDPVLLGDKAPEVVEAPTAVVATTQVVAQEVPELPAPASASDYTSWILYGVIALANVFILILGYLIYRKIAKRGQQATPEDPEDDADIFETLPGEASDEQATDEQDEASALDNLPMDDMSPEELEEEVPETVSEAPESEPEEPAPAPDATVDTQETPAAEAAPSDGGQDAPPAETEVSEDDDDDEDVPEFSLDDFSPESLEEEDLADEDDGGKES